MRWLVLAMVACSASQPLETPSPPVVLAAPEPVGELALPAHEPPPAPVVTGIPDGAISVLAATEDGVSVVTASGSLRLWPVLDGTREPIMIETRSRTAKLAIERAGGDFAIARVDDTGTLELLRLSETGSLRSRIAVVSERPLVDVRMLAGATLALTDDGALVRVAASGRIANRLLPPAGERIATLLVRRGRALALLETTAGVRGRWLDDAAFAWGAATGRLAVVPESAALAPDHQQLATTDAKALKITIIDLATGKRTARPIVLAEQDTFERVGVIGFLDDGLAFTQDGQLKLWRRGKSMILPNSRGFFVRPVATDTRIVSSYGHLVAICDAKASHYLGYPIASPTMVRATPEGVVAFTSRSALLLDDQLAISKRYAFRDAHQVLPIDDRRAIVADRRGMTLVELATGKRLQTLSASGSADYHPATRLLTVSDGRKISFGFYQPRSARFGKLVPFAVTEGVDSSVQLLDPATARGRIAAIVERSFDRFDDTVTIREIRAIRPAAEEPFTYGSTRELKRESANVGFPDITRRKRADGTVVELGNSRLALRDPSGTERWILPVVGISDVVWTAKDELLVIGAGVGVLDVETGAFVRRQCGWDFALTEEPTVDAHGSAYLCSRE